MRLPRLFQFYRQFLEERNAATFIRCVSETYTLSTLHRLMQHDDRIIRRAATVALSYLGRDETVELLGDAMHDPDRIVRHTARIALESLWQRIGTTQQHQRLLQARRLFAQRQLESALVEVDRLLREDSSIAEAWYQRAVVQHARGEYLDAIAAGQQALEKNPYHFRAALHLGRCHLDRGDSATAVRCYYWALQICPDLESARAQIHHLQRNNNRHSR